MGRGREIRHSWARRNGSAKRLGLEAAAHKQNTGIWRKFFLLYFFFTLENCTHVRVKYEHSLPSHPSSSTNIPHEENFQSYVFP